MFLVGTVPQKWSDTRCITPERPCEVTFARLCISHKHVYQQHTNFICWKWDLSLLQTAVLLSLPTAPDMPNYPPLPQNSVEIISWSVDCNTPCLTDEQKTSLADWWLKNDAEVPQLGMEWCSLTDVAIVISAKHGAVYFLSFLLSSDRSVSAT
jgi:hypothetical protein